MAISKFASSRQTSHLSMRSAMPFRDDSLIALPYDSTVASMPPIPLPPRRDPARLADTTRLPRAHSSRTLPGRPIIVTPPTAPPVEEHPALRGTGAASAMTGRAGSERKRDSGLPPTSPSSTLRDEDEQRDAQPCKGALRDAQDGEDDPDEQDLSRSPSAGCVSPANTFGDTAAASGGARELQKQPRQQTSPQSTASSPALGSPTRSSFSSSHPPSPSPSSWADPRESAARDGLSSRRLAAGCTREESSSSSSAVAADATPPEDGPTVDAEPLRRRAPRPPPLPLMPRGRFQGPSPPVASPASQPPPSPCHPPSSPSRFWSPFTISKSSPAAPPSEPDSLSCYEPLSTPIPSDALLEDDFITALSFSQRGSILLGGHRALALDGVMDHPTTPRRDDDDDAASHHSSPVREHQARRPGDAAPVPIVIAPSADEPPAPAHHVSPASALDPELERESEKVRSFYAAGEELRWEEGAPPLSSHAPLQPTSESPREKEEHDPFTSPTIPPPGPAQDGSVSSQQQSEAQRPMDPAEALEDWDDVDPALVDRYGFIEPPRAHSRPGSRMGTPPSLKSVQFSPRRRLQKREPGDGSLGTGHLPRRQYSRRSLNTQHSNMSATSIKSSRSVMRQATNLLPHNRDRRWMDEAGDMLTSSPSLQDLAEEARAEKISEGLKKKEFQRSEKWRKMAKNVKKGEHGEGMEFEFDVKNPKLIERTWKGIPDRWRGAAWWSFMAEHAKVDDNSPSDDSIISDFHRLQQRASPDDVQIDLDVPRTISRHVMFRRRYRGGQRLMFRVLHALSLYFPDTGYVQGMASLAATLLCYFDEEKCFVMMVRMWQLRGLEYLYRPGFEGLLAGLKDFDANWLNKDVARKLNDMGIDNTAYGTRWYLTLFNLSIPFAAQLRVWDVFLLLGGTLHGTAPGARADPAAPPPSMDVLHAASAALIQALRDILLDSDFESAMKALTSWIPIKDEDMLMKVTKAEWKTHQSQSRKNA